VTVAGDISDPETAEQTVATALDRFGRIDTLINNAGIFIAKPFTDYTDEDYRQVLSINLDGFFQITRRAVPHRSPTSSTPSWTSKAHRRSPARPSTSTAARSPVTDAQQRGAGPHADRRSTLWR